MKATESKTFIDSSGWLAYFFAESEKVKGVIENEGILLTSIISIFEIKRKLLKENFELEKIKKIIDFIKKRSILIDLTEEICEVAAINSVKLKLHVIDSLIYTSALKNNSILMTGDEDFRNLTNTLFFGKK